MDDNENDSDQTEVSERYLPLTGPGFSKQMSRDTRFPTMWHFDMNRLKQASAASF